MVAVILALGLIAAGVATGNAGFYWAAGALGVLYGLFLLSVLVVFNKVSKGSKDLFESFNDHRWPK